MNRPFLAAFKKKQNRTTTTTKHLEFLGFADVVAKDTIGTLSAGSRGIFKATFAIRK